MILSCLRARRMFAVVCLLLAGLCVATPAFAQLDYDTYDIYQGGVLVGTIYVPQRAADQPIYSEYWILFANYVYPSEKNPVTTQTAPSTGYHYTSVEDFFAKAPWGKGYRYVDIVALDSSALPGRTATTSGPPANTID
jgi:hypothetical protein